MSPKQVRISAMSYYRLAISRAFAETRAFWNLHQVWKYASPTISAIILRLLVKRWSPVMGWEGFLKEALIFVIVGFVVTWGGTFCINLVRIPPILHRELTEENHKLYAMAHPKVSPDEERKRKHVTNKINRLNRNSKQVLRYIMDHGIIRSTVLDSESGFDRDDINSAVTEGAASDLLQPIGDTLQINPQFRSALDFVLSSEGL